MIWRAISNLASPFDLMDTLDKMFGRFAGLASIRPGRVVLFSTPDGNSIGIPSHFAGRVPVPEMAKSADL